MGIDASKSAYRNRATIQARRNQLRTLFSETLERRNLMAIDGPRLLSIAPNSGEIFAIGSNVLNESPRELVLRFDSAINPTTLQNGIRITRSGGDGVLGTSLLNVIPDVVIPPAFLNFPDPTNQRIVAARFSQPLPDDLYHVELFGAVIPEIAGSTAIRDTRGLSLLTGGNNRITYQFNLEIGTKISAIVPQPIDRSASGVLSQRPRDIEVYFNDGELFDISVTTAFSNPNPPVVDPQFYNLIFTNDTVSPNDDESFQPTTISYDATLRRATLTFLQDLDQLPTIKGSGTFRLRVGSNESVATSLTPVSPTQLDLLTVPSDPGGVLSAARDLGVVSGSFSTIITQEIRAVNPLIVDFPGSNFEPGHRDIQDETHQGAASGEFADADPEITTIFYSFMDNQPYGRDIANRPVFSSITAEQKQRVREIFEFYSAQLGIDVIEHLGPSVAGDGIKKIVVGDLAPNGGESGPGDVIGLAELGGELAIMDGAEAWDNTFGYGSNIPGTASFFETSLHEIGHLLGLGHTYDLPPGTLQGSSDALGRPANPLEQVFPGDHDVVHGQHLFRPDNRDVDLYRFTVAPGTTGELRAETIAERLNTSSNLDTYLTLLRRESNGTLRIIAANNNYFSEDSLVRATLEPGEYFLSVTGRGNEDNNPLIANSGSGATSQGNYELRIDFKTSVASQLTESHSTNIDTPRTALDGNGDGLAGGNFDFWFRVATAFTPAGNPAVRTLFVDKAFAGATRNGSLANPFNRIVEATAVARPGDIIRLVGDNRTPDNLRDDNAFEIGDGGGAVGILRDGSTLNVPRGVTMMIDSGAILKFGGSRILVGSNDSTTDRSGSAIQVLGTPQRPVFFTSYLDESLGRDTNPLNTTPAPGNWGGIEIRNDFDRAQGRLDREREGIFLNTISNADMRFGGGLVGVSALAKTVNPIDLSEARPLIIGNRISFSSDAAISADPNSFEETLFTEPRYQSGGLFIPDYSRVGPDIRSNTLLDNSTNGLFVRIDTLAGSGLKSLNVPARINDSEITIVLGENLLIEGTPGGSLSEIVGPAVSLVTLNVVAPAGGSTGFAAATGLEYVITYVDRFGQESLPSTRMNIVVPANQAVQLANLPTATLDYVSRKIYRRENNAGNFLLVATINKDDTLFVDNGRFINGAIQTLGQTNLLRARRDASLVIDPGVVIKSQGGRIEVGIGATMLAEGTVAKPIVFTSRRDDRYGAGGSLASLTEAREGFDTNNDGTASVGAEGNWAGIISRHLGELSIDNAVITFGGGESRIPGGFASFNTIEAYQSSLRITNSLIENNGSGASNLGSTNRDARGVNEGAVIFVLSSQPVILNNAIRNNSIADTAAISIDANSLNTRRVVDYGRSTGMNERESIGLGNFGPLVSNNRLGGNALNGMRVRGATLTTESVWDDTDIVHILQSEIVVPDFHTYGGLRLTSKANESLVVKLSGADAGFTATGQPLDIIDRIGGSLQLLGSPGFPVVLTSLSDDTIGAGFGFDGRDLVDTNNDDDSVGIVGDWRSVLFDAFANDRNVDQAYEREADLISSEGANDFPDDAQDIGQIASNINAGDENIRLGMTVTGSIASPSDIDVYRFTGTAGTMVWIDIDQTSGTLDTVVELIDGNGQIIVLSDNSVNESEAGSVFFNPGLIPNNRAFPMDQQAFAKRNALSTAQVDFLSTNPLDAGFRVSLPGSANSLNDYFIRVRSSNVTPTTPDAMARLTDPGAVREGVSVGLYKLQVRLQQTQEVSGSTVRFADIRFATRGLDVQSQPMHSLLVGETGEQNPTETDGFNLSQAQVVGNVLATDRAAISIAGRLAAEQDIDLYRFTVARQGIQQVNTTPASHISVIIDIDYADGLGRADTQIAVFTPAGVLVLIADDSNIHDDQVAPNQVGANSDFSRGSFGTRDAYLGPIELPAGDYILAIFNKSLTVGELAELSTPAGVGEVRFEPIDSVRRIAEERFDAMPPARLTTAAPPERPDLFTLDGVLTSAVPFNLSDVPLFSVSGRRVNTVNALTGAIESRMSSDGVSLIDYGVNDNPITDLAVSPGGKGLGFQAPNGDTSDANSGQFIGLDFGNDVDATGTSGLSTLMTRQTPDSDPPTFEVIQVPVNGNNVGVGMRFDGFTYSSNFATNVNGANIASLWGVASRYAVTGARQPIMGIDANGAYNPIGVGLPVVNRNALYRLSSYDGTVGTALNPIGTALDNNETGWGAGTRIMAHGFFVQSGTINANSNVSVVAALGTVSGLASIGNRLFAVTERGELMGMTPSNAQRHVFSDTYDILLDPESGDPIAFSGLTAGPRSLQDETINYSEILFGVSTAGRMYAFDVDGNFLPIFPRGASFIDNTASLGNSRGINFSSLDSNLFHVSRRSGTGATAMIGHGRQRPFNDSSDLQTGSNNSIRFAYADPTEGVGTQPNEANDIYRVPELFNTYAGPGGARGAVESQLLDLRSYSPDDQPYLYFNYLLNTEDTESALDDRAALDTFRVYGRGADGVEILLATNNGTTGTGGYTSTRTNFAGAAGAAGSDEFDVAVSRNLDAFNRHRLTTPLFDNTAGWRQARVSLASLAGKQDVRLRFEFATSGDFRTADATRGGLELLAVPGERIQDGDNFTVGGSTFEFDLGLVLNIPSGPSVKTGDSIIIGTDTFTFSNAGGAFDIPFLAADSPAVLAQKVAGVLQANGYTVTASSATANVLNVTALIGVPLSPTETYSIAGADPAIIAGLPGVADTNIQLPITNAMSALEVREVIRDGLALALNVPGEETNIEVFRVRGNSILLHDTAALVFTNNINARTLSRGVVVVSGNRIGDSFGPIDAGGNRFAAASLAGRNNTVTGTGGPIGGLQIDDIIIGFAERGEVVLNATAGAQIRPPFVPTPNYEPVLAPGQPAQNAIELGTYQAEIRAAADYGLTPLAGTLNWIDPLTGFPSGRSFGTNDRLTKSISLAIADTSAIVDGSSFTLSDGNNTLRFEFDVATTFDPLLDPATGVAQGNIPIRIAPNATSEQIAAAIRNAINSTAAQASLKITASTRGDTFGGIPASTLPRAVIIDIAGNVSTDVLGGLSGFAFGGAPIVLAFGQDTVFGEDLGDSNRRRDQGQFIISSSVVRDSAEFGVNISAFNSGTSTRPFPGVARNLVTLNSSDVAPGVVVMNNVIENNRQGGIRISGAPGVVSPTVVEGPIGIARVLNNTIVGGGTGAGSVGIQVTDRASPTIVNNILANHATGISASGIGAPTIVLGGNLYKDNGTNRTPAVLVDSHEIVLASTAPLFIDQTRRRYYLAPLSQAIDSSIASLENRSSLEQVKDGVGLPVSSILAPTFDVNGLRRSDDPDVNTPAGQGGNVFIDRGAIDRVDFIGPIAIIQRPLDNDSLGIDDDISNTYLQLEGGNLDFFEILLDERTGTGTDPLTITEESVILTENGRRLIEDSDYVFGFSANSRTIRLTPRAGFWRSDSIYEITLINRQALQLNIPTGRSLTDGALTSIVVGTTTVTLEFDSNGTVASGNVPILFTTASTSEAISIQIFRAIQAIGGGASVTALGSDVLLLDGVTDVIGLPIVRLVPIEDMAANPLQANRANSLTQFTIVMPDVAFDFGDGQIRTPFAEDGARNAIFPSDSNNLFLGQFVDSESDGTAGSLANSDDLNGPLDANGLVINDEDGVTFTGVFNEHVIPAVTVSVVVTGNGYLDAWFDWNRDGDYSDEGEQVLTSVAVSNGTFTFLQQAPAGAEPGFTTARFRLSSKNGGTDFGVGIGGEVEDYLIEVLPGHPPVAVNDPATTKEAFYRVDEEGVLIVSAADGILFNDTDVDVPAELLQVNDEDLNIPGVQPVRGPVNGTLVLNLDGSFTYTPNVDFFGEDTFAYRVTDPRLVSNNIATVTITVNPINDDPLAFDDVETINEDNVTEWEGSRFTSNDFAGATAALPPASIANEETQTLTVVGARFVLEDRVTTRPALAGESISVVNNVIRYTPGTNYNNDIAGPVFIELEVLDDGVSGFPALPDFRNSFSILTVNINAVNDSPSFSLVEPDAATIAPTTTTEPTINTNGEMSMTVNVNEDAALQRLSIFSNITAGPSTALDELGLVPGVPGQIINVNVNVRPQDNYLFTTAGRPRVVNRQADGTAQLEFTLAPDANTLLLGPAIVTFQLDDQGGPGLAPNGPTGPLSRMHTVTINARPVNDPPILGDDSRTFREDVAQTWSQAEFLANDVSGPANENRQVLSIVAARLVAPRVGEVLTLASGIIRYTPAPNYNQLIGGNVLIELDVQDSLDVGDQGTVQTRTSTLTLTITAENDSPTFSLVELSPISTVPAVDPNTGEMSMTLNVNEDAPTQNLRIFGGVAVAPPTALDELGLVPNVPGQPTNFIVSLRPQDVGLFTSFGQPRVNLLTGGAAELEFTLNPDANSLTSGPAVITFQIDDRGGIGLPPNGPTGPTSVVHTVTINVRPVNDPPVVGNDSRTIVEDVAQSWAEAEFLANDSVGPPNENAQTLSIVGARVISPVWPGQSVSVANGRILYTPGTNYNRLISGNVLIALDVRDTLDVGDQGRVETSVSTLTITIDPVNDSPVFNLVQVTPITSVPTTNPTTGSMSLTATLDEDTPTPRIAIFEGIAPAPQFANDELGLVDGLPAQPTDFIVTVRPQDQFLFTTAGLPRVNLLANGRGELQFTLAPNANTSVGSPAIITFQINDQSGLASPPNGPTGSFSRVHTVTLAITPVNDAPIAVNDQYSISEDFVLTVAAPGLISNDQDVDLPDDVLSINGFSAVSSLGATVSVAPNGQLTYDPRSAIELQRLLDGATAIDTFTYTIRDRAGAVSGVATVTVTVTGVNDAPVAVNDNVNTPVDTLRRINVLANDSDVDNAINPATVEIGELPIFGSVTVLATGEIEYRPNAGYRGVDTFTYRVRDILGRASNEARVSVTVNAAPVALPDNAVVGRGQSVVIDVLLNDSDRDGTLDPSSVRIVGGPDSGVAVVLPNGRIEFTANAQFVGLANLQYIVSDNDGLASNIADVTVNVVRSIYQNPANNLDVNADTFVSPIDVLIIINDINFNGVRVLPNGLATPPFLDVDGDRSVSPLDVLELINFINNRGNAGAGSEGNGEGEGSDWLATSQVDVVMMPLADVLKVNREAQERLAMEEGIDLAVAAEFDSSLYGPMLPIMDGLDEDQADSLESYLAKWSDAEKKSETFDFDSVFAADDWSQV